jgi:hypothetical protein
LPSKRIEAALARLLGARPAEQAEIEPDAALENELMAHFERVHPQTESAEGGGGVGGMFAFARMHRWALTGVLAGLASIGACYAPADVEVPLGVTVEFISHDEDPHALVQQVVGYVEDSTGATEVGVSALKSHDGPLQIRMRVWGPGVPADLEEELAGVFPQLEVAELTSHPLEGRVRTTLGRRLGHQWLDLALREDDLERARADLLAQLAAEGLEGDVDIEIREHDGHQEVRVRVEQHVTGDLTPPE